MRSKFTFSTVTFLYNKLVLFLSMLWYVHKGVWHAKSRDRVGIIHKKINLRSLTLSACRRVSYLAHCVRRGFNIGELVPSLLLLALSHD